MNKNPMIIGDLTKTVETVQRKTKIARAVQYRIANGHLPRTAAMREISAIPQRSTLGECLYHALLENA